MLTKILESRKQKKDNVKTAYNTACGPNFFVCIRNLSFSVNSILLFHSILP